MAGSGLQPELANVDVAGFSLRTCDRVNTYMLMQKTNNIAGHGKPKGSPYGTKFSLVQACS